jgi:hypothetical protein
MLLRRRFKCRRLSGRKIDLRSFKNFVSLLLTNQPALGIEADTGPEPNA